MEQHDIALAACKAVGIGATSNVHAALKWNMKPVGTTGHEHQQRWGDDYSAFCAIRDMRPAMPGYLFDTFDAMGMGIPAAVRAMRDDPNRLSAVRFDSGDQDAQLRKFVECEQGQRGVKPIYIFMDGINSEKVRHFEALCHSLDIPTQRSFYGSGGFLTCDPSPNPLTRNRVSAVYKLCQSGSKPVMKFSIASKQSLPGRPVIYRRDPEATNINPLFVNARGVIAQQGEDVPLGFKPIEPGDPWISGPSLEYEIMYSMATRFLMREVLDKVRRNS